MLEYYANEMSESKSEIIKSYTKTRRDITFDYVILN